MSVASARFAPSSSSVTRPFGRRHVSGMAQTSPAMPAMAISSLQQDLHRFSEDEAARSPALLGSQGLAQAEAAPALYLQHDHEFVQAENWQVSSSSSSGQSFAEALSSFLNRAGHALEEMVSSLKVRPGQEDAMAPQTLARCWESLPAEAPFDAPARRLASARARLLTGEARAVIDILDAATEDKRLLNLAARSVLKWLKKDGGAHDTPQFRMFLMRTLRLSEAALEERSRPPQEESLQSDTFPTERVMERMRACLRDWQEDIREAWIIGRRCDLLPEWPHWDVIVEVRPRALMGAEDVPARVEELRQAMRRALERIWLDEGSLGVHLHPVQVQHGLLSQVRDHGRPVFATSRLYALNQEKAGKPHTPAEKAEEKDPNPLSVFLHEATRPVRDFLKRLNPPRPVRWGIMIVGGLAVLFAGYRLFYANVDTTSKIAQLEQHQHEVARKANIWRFEDGANEKDPAGTLESYRLAMQAKDKSPLLPIYTEESRKAYQGRFMSLVAMEKEWALLTACGRPEIRMKGDYAIAMYPHTAVMQNSICLPRFFHKEGGRWRYDRLVTERVAPLFTQHVQNVKEALAALSRRDPQGRTFTLRTMHLPLEFVPAAYLAAYRARPLPYTPAP